MHKWYSRSPLLIKFFNWEYWPAWLTNIPVVLMWWWFALRARHLFFFSAANPAIITGGVLGESKIKALNQLKPEWKPKTAFIPAGTIFSKLLEAMEKNQIIFPMIAKPDTGERGLMVEKIKDENALQIYHRKMMKFDFLLQEFVSEPLEVSILHYRFPDQKKGHISSFCTKKHLSVTGDGESNLHALIQNYPRALLQKKEMQARWGESLNRIPDKDKKVVLLPIGNHCRGAMFLNANPQIDAQLHQIFDEVSNSLEGILFCRYDIICRSIEDLKAGKHFYILELNGVAGEPAHIYDPSYPVWKAYRDMWRQWRVIFQISQAQHKKGTAYMSLSEVREVWKKYWKGQKGLNDLMR